MSVAFKRAGVLYGKAGFATPAALIESRYPGIEAAAKALTLESLPELIRAIFGLSGNAEGASFLGHFGSDPTFDVRPADKEAALLATAIADYTISEELNIAGQVALLIVTAGIGGIRPPKVPSDILSIANTCLTTLQRNQLARPSGQQMLKTPKALTDAIELVRTQQPAHNYLPQILPAIVAAFEKVDEFVEKASRQAVSGNNTLLAYIVSLEEEMQTHWWVSGGWSEETRSFFRDLQPVDAAIRAGWELAAKGSAALGLYAAPALLGLVLERGRAGIDDVTLEAASAGTALAWRKTNYEALAATGWISLLPVSTMFALSAEAEDAPDWKATFKRRTGINMEATINPIDLGVQVYRERLVRKLLQA